MAYFLDYTIVENRQLLFEWLDGSVPPQFIIGDVETLPLESAMVPKKAAFSHRGKSLPDFGLVNARLVISQRVMTYLSRLDPERNQFFPFDIFRKGELRRSKDEDLQSEGKYFLINVTDQIDAVIPDKSNVRIGPGNPPLISLKAGMKDQVTLSMAKISGHHLWRGRHQLNKNIMISDAFANSIKKEGWDYSVRLTAIREE